MMVEASLQSKVAKRVLADRWLEVLQELVKELEVDSRSGGGVLVHLLESDVLQDNLPHSFAFPTVQLLFHEQSSRQKLPLSFCPMLPGDSGKTFTTLLRCWLLALTLKEGFEPSRPETF